MEEVIGRIQNIYPFNKKTRVNRSYKIIFSLLFILSLNVNYSFSQSNNNIWLSRFLEQGTVVGKLDFIAGIHEKGKMNNLKTMRSYIDSLEKNSGYKKDIFVYQTLIKSYDLVEKNENVALIKLIDPIKDKYNEKIQYCFYYQLVHAYYDIGFYMKASSYFVKYRELKNTLYPNLLSYTNPGTFYFEAGLYKKAIVEYKSEYENEYLSKKQDKTRMKNFLGSMSNNIGLCFGKLGEVDSAIFYFDKALVHWHNCKPNDQLYNQYLENLISGNKGGLKIQLKEYNEAIP
ncbi:MAG: hypothetical protein HRT73_12830, partial [Flavobacteriales bacterium]|nr:hypothetical protein [Flavobacteriales bacterium]